MAQATGAEPCCEYDHPELLKVLDRSRISTFDVKTTGRLPRNGQPGARYGHDVALRELIRGRVRCKIPCTDFTASVLFRRKEPSMLLQLKIHSSTHTKDMLHKTDRSTERVAVCTLLMMTVGRIWKECAVWGIGCRKELFWAH